MLKRVSESTATLHVGHLSEIAAATALQAVAQFKLKTPSTKSRSDYKPPVLSKRRCLTKPTFFEHWRFRASRGDTWGVGLEGISIPEPSTLNPKSLNPKSLNPKPPKSLNPKPEIPESLNPKPPKSLNPKPEIPESLNPKP